MKRQTIVIFGATGDLTKRKLIPALYRLFDKGFLIDLPIICIGRRNLTKEEYLDVIEIDNFLARADKKKLDHFKELIEYYSFDFAEKDYNGLEKYLDKIDKKYKCDNNKIFYLATGESLFDKVISRIAASNILKKSGLKKVVFEKPFGHDIDSARELNKTITKVFSEDEIYRIDHYLGKELVQNIIALRFANSIFEETWNKNFVDNVQIIVSEKLGVENRAGYYDKTGAIRDMIQNHLLQMLSLVCMEPPKSMKAEHIRDEKTKVLEKTRVDDFVTGQYVNGEVDGKKVAAYIDEKGIHKNSETETFAAVKMLIDNQRWEGVPFFLITGKRLKERYAEINLTLKDVACNLFSEYESGSNVISIQIQPSEGIAIRFNVKKPGEMGLNNATMEFCHACEYAMATPEAYEKLLSEIMKGNQTLFTRWDGLELSWKIIDPLVLESAKKKPYRYESGISLPMPAIEMLRKDGAKFTKIERKLV